MQNWQSSIFQTKSIMLERHRSFLYSLYKAFVSYQSTNYRYQAVSHLINGFLSGSFWYIGVQLYFDGIFTLGKLGGGNTFLNQCTSALQSFVSNLGQISFALASYRRVADFIEAKQVISPFTFSEPLKNISFNNINFQFEENKVIENLSFECNASDWVVCIGENGTGKTSLLRLIAGLELPTYGSIIIYGCRTVPYFCDDWMKQIIFIEPHPFIINGTISNNFMIADGQVRQKEIERLFDSIGYRHFWTELPMGLNTEVSSSQDTVLSHGQRQIIEWVRWLIYPPHELYLLDEPLTGVVPEVKRKCLEALKSHAPNSIVVVTTQEPELKELADFLLVFQKQKPISLITQK